MKKTMQMNFVDYTFYKDKNNRKNAIVGGLFKFANTENLPFKQKVIENLNKRVNSYPILSSKIVESNIKDDYPYYVVDSNFNINNHVFEYNVFSQSEFDTLVKKIWLQEIDFKKPLWEYHIINYLKDTYILRRCHHAMGDGSQLSEAVSCSDIFHKKRNASKIYFISKKRAYVNKFIKKIKMFYYFLKGFLLAENKQLQIKSISREFIHRGEWRNKKDYSLDFAFAELPLKEVKHLLKKNSLTTLDFALLVETLCYKDILEEKHGKTKDLISLIPKSYTKLKHYGNDVLVLAVDIPVSESDLSVMIKRIKKSLKEQASITEKSPHKYYATAYRMNTKISNTQKAYAFANMSDWSNRRKIPKRKKDFYPISTSTTYFNADAVTGMVVCGKKIEESYGISMPINVPGSIGIAMQFRKQGDSLYVGVSCFKEIFDSEYVKSCLNRSFNKAVDYLAGR